jgi:hypothetical protein
MAPKPSKPTFAMNEPLKIAIIKSGKRQRLIARAARIDETRLSHIVRGRLQANSKEQERLARVLNTTVPALFLPGTRSSAATEIRA